jgi:hypothetical protein
MTYNALRRRHTFSAGFRCKIDCPQKDNSGVIMRTLKDEELKDVQGGLDLVDAAAMIASVATFSPVTMAFGYPIAAALITIDVLSE